MKESAEEPIDVDEKACENMKEGGCDVKDKEDGLSGWKAEILRKLKVVRDLPAEEMDVEFRKVMEEKESARWWRKGRQRLRRRAKRRSFRTVVKCSAQITSVFSPPQRVDFRCCQAFRKTIFGLNSCRPGFALLRAILKALPNFLPWHPDYCTPVS